MLLLLLWRKDERDGGALDSSFENGAKSLAPEALTGTEMP